MIEYIKYKLKQLPYKFEHLKSTLCLSCFKPEFFAFFQFLQKNENQKFYAHLKAL